MPWRGHIRKDGGVSVRFIRLATLKAISNCMVTRTPKDPRNGKIYFCFVSKIVMTYCEKNCFSDWKKTFETRGWMSRIYKNFEITRTRTPKNPRNRLVYMNSIFQVSTAKWMREGFIIYFPRIHYLQNLLRVATELQLVVIGLEPPIIAKLPLVD